MFYTFGGGAGGMAGDGVFFVTLVPPFFPRPPVFDLGSAIKYLSEQSRNLPRLCMELTISD